MTLEVLGWNLHVLLLNLPPARLTYMARNLIEAAQQPRHGAERPRPDEVWSYFVGAARKVVGTNPIPICEYNSEILR